jgi:hypothetical protein
MMNDKSRDEWGVMFSEGRLTHSGQCVCVCVHPLAHPEHRGFMNDVFPSHLVMTSSAPVYL